MTVENLNINVNTNADSAAEKIRSLSSALDKVQGAAKNAGSSSSAVAKGVKAVGQAAKNTNKPLSTFLSSIKRIAFYRFIRGIIKSITQSFSEGLEKAYLFSSKMSGEGNRFAQSMDRLTSASNAMKGQLGSAFIGLVAAVEPILMRLIDLVTRVADAVSQLFAAFTGGTYLKATATAAQFSDAMAKGAGSAKEWKNQIMGFDEINRLEAPSGGGGSSSNPLEGFEMKDTPIADWAIKVKDIMVEVFGELKGLWEELKDGFISTWENLKKHIDFKKFFEDMVKVLRGVVQLVTGILSGDWAKAFEGAANIVSGVVGIINSLLDWLGSIVDNLFGWISGLVDSFFAWVYQKTGLKLTSLHTLIKNTVENVRTFLSNTIQNAKTILTGLTDFLGGLFTGNWKRMWQGLVTIAEGVVNQIINTLVTMINSFANGLNWLLDKVDWGIQKLGGQGIEWRANTLTVPTVSFGGGAYNSQPVISRHTGIQEFASGGFPDAGLFIAGESGPELVGTMGGRTAVSNNDQIVEGIRAGVYDAVVAAMANGNNSTPIPVEIDGRRIAEILYPYNRQVNTRHGVSLINA